jgi:hypothetical protein
MPKFRGTVRRSDLEGGLWELCTDGGEVYEIEGGGPDLLRDGARVEVEGKVDRGMMSIGMRSGVLRVSKARTV